MPRDTSFKKLGAELSSLQILVGILGATDLHTLDDNCNAYLSGYCDEIDDHVDNAIELVSALETALENGKGGAS